MPLLLSAVYFFALGVLAHYIGEALPRRWFTETRFPFRCFRFEREGEIYAALGIKRWKNRLPDMSRYMKDMLPKRVDRKASSAQVENLIRETCVAEFIHGLLAVLSFGVCFAWKRKTGLIVAMLGVIGNIPFILIQRYNRPHLLRLRDRLKIREEKMSVEDSDSVL